jgi:hypothetical protein
MTPLKEALIALADVLAKRPAQEILFDWFRSGRLVGELSVLIKRRHPEVQAEIDRIYRGHLAKLGKRGGRPEPRKTIDYLRRGLLRTSPAFWRNHGSALTCRGVAADAR